MNNLFFCTDKNLINLIPYIFKTFLKFNDPEKYIINFILYDDNNNLHIDINNILNKLSDKFNFEYKYFIPSKKFKNLLDKYYNLLKQSNFIINTSVYCNYSNWSRFFISKLFPNIEKGLYLDMDILFSGNIDELFNIDLSNNIIGVVPYTNNIINDIKKGKHFTLDHEIMLNKLFEELNLNFHLIKTNNSYNCGVIYFNFNLFKKNNILKKIFTLLNFYIKNDIIFFKTGTEKNQNILIPKYKILSSKYNFIINNKKIESNLKLKENKIIHFKCLTNLTENKIYLQKYKYIINI